MSIILNGTTGITTPGLINTGAETVVNLTTSGNTILGDASTDTLNVAANTLVTDGAGNVGIGTASPSEKLTVSGNASLSSNLNFTGTGNRITGDFSNGTQSNRVAFQTSTSNSNTSVTILPNGTGAQGALNVFNNSNPDNSAYFQIKANATVADLFSGTIGTGTALPMTFSTGGSERMRIDTSGNVGIGTSSPASRLTVGSGDARVSNGALYVYRTSYPVLEMNQSGSTGVGQFAMNGNNLEIRQTQAFDTLFYTNNAERMRIDSNGNVGIGTNSGTGGAVNAKLDVLSNIVGGQTLSMQKWSWNDSTSSTSWGLKLDQIHTGSAINYSFRIRNGSSTDIEALYLQSTGRVGIGTSTPSSTLTVAGATGVITLTSTTGANYSLLSVTNTGTSFYCGIESSTGSSLFTGTSPYSGVIGTTAAYPMAFATNNAERMRIDSSGVVLIGSSTAAGGAMTMSKGGAGGGCILVFNKPNSGATNVILNYYGATYVGGMNMDNSTTSFITSSDLRLKKDVVDAASATDKVNAIRVVSHGWNHDDAVVDFGVIAQELYDIAPRAVTKGDDGEEVETVWSVDYSKLVPMLIKAHQELKAELDVVKAELNTLKGN